jgi:hypothetical protein
MGGRGVGSMGASGAYGYKELRRTPSTSAIYETLRRSKELRESLTRPSSRLSMDEKIRDSVRFRFFHALLQWFSTFLSLRHTNFDNKFCGTPKCKRDQNVENLAVFGYFL